MNDAYRRVSMSRAIEAMVILYLIILLHKQTSEQQNKLGNKSIQNVL